MENIGDIDLSSLVGQIPQFGFPERERTIFSLGARGYYENAASDMLAFFLRPDAEHGLSDLFLSAFFECIKKQIPPGPQQISVEREVVTKNQNRIDLQITGTDWCLLVENKIWHIANNPFWDYEEHAKLYPSPLFAILSPEGKSCGKWTGVKYADYCAKLRDKLGKKLFDSAPTKWHLFAREFVIHLESEIYALPMTSTQAAFVEQHSAELLQARKLLDEYPKYLCDVIKCKLAEKLTYEVNVYSNWAIIIESKGHWADSYFALRTPIEIDKTHRRLGSPFDISFYPTDGKLKAGECTAEQKNVLMGLKYLSKGSCWVSEQGYSDLLEAVSAICRLIKLAENNLMN